MTKWTWILALICAVGFCQQAQKIAFEVASIKPAEPSPMGQMRIAMRTDDGMLRYTNVSLKECIRNAYRVKEFQIQGPDWMGSTRYDIQAKFPAGATKDQVPEMLQALLAERFKLTLHRDKKEHALLALIVAKGGAKLKPAAIATSDTKMPAGAMKMMITPEGAHLMAPSATLAGLAESLSRFSERPVVDMTGVDGKYDFDLTFVPESLPGMPGGMRLPMGGGEHPAAEGTAGSMYDAVQRYGLKLDARKAPMEVIIIDHIEKTPTEN